MAADLVGIGERLLDISVEIVRQDAWSTNSSAGRPQILRARILRQVEQVIEAYPSTPQSVTALALRCGVSERTLRNAFSEYYRIGPKRYLQLLKMHEVRRALRAAQPGQVTVSAVMTRYGETEFGRFAQRYRATFGELPSQTLALAERQDETG